MGGYLQCQIGKRNINSGHEAQVMLELFSRGHKSETSAGRAHATHTPTDVQILAGRGWRVEQRDGTQTWKVEAARSRCGGEHHVNVARRESRHECRTLYRVKAVCVLMQRVRVDVFLAQPRLKVGDSRMRMYKDKRASGG